MSVHSRREYDMYVLGRIAAILEEIARDLDLNLTRARDPSFARELLGDYLSDRDRVRQGDLLRASNLAAGLARDCDLCLALHRDLYRAYLRAGAHDLNSIGLAYKSDRDRVLAFAGGAQELALLVERTCMQVVDVRTRISTELERAEQPGGRTPVAVSKAAGRVVAWAVRALPVEDRARYSQEFQCELWELAAAGKGHTSQLRYAVRQLVCVLSLRRELNASHAGRRIVS